jgi:hypothetical protein
MDRRRGCRAVVVAVAVGVLGCVAPPARAVNAPQTQVTSEDPINNTPRVLDGRVYAIAKVGGTIVVGGTFTQVQHSTGGTTYARNSIMAFDEATGAVSTTFQPVLNGIVNGLATAPDGQSVYVGGAFTTVNGANQRGITRLNVTTGVRDATFTARTTSTVNDVIYNNGRVYIGGYFGQVNGVVRERLAGVDATTGALLPGPNSTIGAPFQGSSLVAKLDVSPSGNRLVAIGSFTLVDGQSRMQIAQWDLSGPNATLSTWRTDRFDNLCAQAFFYYVRDVDFAPDGSYFAVVNTGAYRRPPALCDVTTRWEANTTGANQQPTWATYTGGDSLWSVAVTSAAVYVSGHPRWQNNSWASNAAGDGAVPRQGIAALDPLTGMPLRWDPTKERGVGSFALVATEDRLYVGSDTDLIGGENHPKLGAFPLAGGYTPIQPTALQLPVTLHHVRGAAAHDVHFDGATPTDTGTIDSATDWSSVLGAFSQLGRVYYVTGDGRFYSRSWNGTVAGPPLDLITDAGYAATLPRGWDASIRELAYEQGRLYYTKAGSDSVFWRWFGLDANVLGAEEFVASNSGGAWIRGFEVVGSRAYLAFTDGRLYGANVTTPGTIDVAGRFVIDSGASGIPWATSADLWATQATGDPPPPPPAGEIAYGAFVRPNNGESETGAIQRFEALVDRPLDVVRVFETWEQPFPDSYHNWLRDSGHRVLLSVYPTRNDGSRVLWSEIANAAPGSTVSNEIVSWADRVRDFGGPVLFSFHHEPETSDDIPFGVDTEYVAAWRKVIDTFRAEGATNAEFIWIMTDYSFDLPQTDRRAAAHWYPGDDVVDAIGADAYNWYTCRSTAPIAWKSPAEIITGLRDFGLAHPSTDLWLPEFASTEDPADLNRKGQWMTDLRALLQSPGWEQFVGALHYNQVLDVPGNDCNFWVDSSTPTLVAVQALAADPYFGGDGTPPPPPPAGADVVFVVANPAALNASDQAALAHLSTGGNDVDVVDDDTVQTGDTTGADLVVISATSGETVGTRLRVISVPILTWKPYIYDDLRMTGSVATTDFGNRGATQISMTAINHPLRNGLTGTQTITTSSRSIGWAHPLASADVIANVGADPTLFVYQTGDALTIGTAPGCRIGFPGGSVAMEVFNATGWSLFDNAIAYAEAGCV